MLCGRYVSWNGFSTSSNARQRILEIDAKNAGRSLPLGDGGSLHSGHAAAQLWTLCEAAQIAELPPDSTGRRCFILQHVSEPSARLAETWVLPKFPSGRFDAGTAGAGGVGPTLERTRTHEVLPLAAAERLVAHVLHEFRGQAIEAAAALPGLSAWVATQKATELDEEFGVPTADAAMLMALDGESISAFPSGMKTRLAARPAWEALAGRYARTAAAEEAALYRKLGAEDVGIAYMADPSSEGLRESGGAMSLLVWPLDGAADAQARAGGKIAPPVFERPKCGLA